MRAGLREDITASEHEVISLIWFIRGLWEVWTSFWCSKKGISPCSFLVVETECASAAQTNNPPNTSGTEGDEMIRWIKLQLSEFISSNICTSKKASVSLLVINYCSSSSLEFLCFHFIRPPDTLSSSITSEWKMDKCQMEDGLMPGGVLSPGLMKL